MLMFVYVVVERSDQASEGGGVFPSAYDTFEKAKAAAISKYQSTIDEQLEESGDESIMKDIDVSESKTGFTYIYIEKEINIFIHKLPVKTSGGKRSKTQRKRGFFF